MKQLGFNPAELFPEDDQPESLLSYFEIEPFLYRSFEDVIIQFLDKLTTDKCNSRKNNRI